MSVKDCVFLQEINHVRPSLTQWVSSTKRNARASDSIAKTSDGMICAVAWMLREGQHFTIRRSRVLFSLDDSQVISFA